MTPQYHCVCRSQNAWEYAGSCTCTNIMTQLLRLLVSFATFVLINKCTLKLFLMIRMLGTTIPCYRLMLTLLTIGIECEDRLREPNLMNPLLFDSFCSFLPQSTRVGQSLLAAQGGSPWCLYPGITCGLASPWGGLPADDSLGKHWLGLRFCRSEQFYAQ